MKEIELKIRLNNSEEIVIHLKTLGVEFGVPKKQYDKIYLQKGVEYPLKLGINVLRIREEEGKFIFTLKRPEEIELSKVEYETLVEKPEELEKIILDLGWVKYVEITKTRRKGKIGDINLCLDKVEGLGDFLEAEIFDEVGGIGVQNRLKELFFSWGIEINDIVSEGYDVLIVKMQRPELFKTFQK